MYEANNFILDEVYNNCIKKEVSMRIQNINNQQQPKFKARVLNDTGTRLYYPTSDVVQRMANEIGTKNQILVLKQHLEKLVISLFAKDEMEPISKYQSSSFTNPNNFPEFLTEIKPQLIEDYRNYRKGN